MALNSYYHIAKENPDILVRAYNSEGTRLFAYINQWLCTSCFLIKGQPSKRQRQNPGGGESNDDSGTVCNLSYMTSIKLTKNRASHAANNNYS